MCIVWSIGERIVYSLSPIGQTIVQILARINKLHQKIMEGFHAIQTGGL
jgi:hypothetical protein